MATDIKAPDFPESVDEGTLAEWLKQSGDAVARDEKIAAVETDKIVLDVYALEAGTLEVLIEEGDTVARGAVLARISGGGGNGSKAAKSSKSAKPATKEASPPAAKPAAKTEVPAPEAAPAPAANTASLSPSVRQLIHEHGLDPSSITGTGKNGRILKADVEKAIKSGGASAAPAPQSAPAASAPRPVAVPPSADGDLPQRRVPMSRIRATIARRLKEVQDTAAILTTFNEVNMKPVMDIRSRYKENFLKEYGVKLGFMSFFTKAVCEALKKYPAINASVEGDDIIYHEYYNVSIAIDSPRGLVVPVIQHADQLSFAEIERGIRVLAEKAREGKLAYADLVGGTFTITNGGTFGSMLSTPILNAPQSAILGMHNIVQRPWVENGEVVVRPIMYVALSYDHRIIDGSDAVRFLVSVKESLENPEKLLLQL